MKALVTTLAALSLTLSACVEDKKTKTAPNIDIFGKYPTPPSETVQPRQLPKYEPIKIDPEIQNLFDEYMKDPGPKDLDLASRAIKLLRNLKLGEYAGFVKPKFSDNEKMLNFFHSTCGNFVSKMKAASKTENNAFQEDMVKNLCEGDASKITLIDGKYLGKKSEGKDLFGHSFEEKEFVLDTDFSVIAYREYKLSSSGSVQTKTISVDGNRLVTESSHKGRRDLEIDELDGRYSYSSKAFGDQGAQRTYRLIYSNFESGLTLKISQTNSEIKKGLYEPLDRKDQTCYILLEDGQGKTVKEHQQKTPCFSSWGFDLF